MSQIVLPPFSGSATPSGPAGGVLGGTYPNPSFGFTGLTITAGALSSATIAAGTIVASAPGLSITQTWNNGAVVFTGLSMRITNTASDAASLLFDFGTTGGGSVFSCDTNGNVLAQGHFRAVNTIYDNGDISAPFSAFDLGCHFNLTLTSNSVTCFTSFSGAETRLNGSFVSIASGVPFRLGNAATTGLAAGVLAALTNATIVIQDSTGQAYRIPCII